jgi:uncharacterized glyoxalase superfamily protein PhnB
MPTEPKRHAEARLGDSIIEFADAGSTWNAMPAGLHYYVKNSDEVYAPALKAEATSLYEPTNRDYGDREAGVRDPAGNFCSSRRISEEKAIGLKFCRTSIPISA